MASCLYRIGEVTGGRSSSSLTDVLPKVLEEHDGHPPADTFCCCRRPVLMPVSRPRRGASGEAA